MFFLDCVLFSYLPTKRPVLSLWLKSVLSSWNVYGMNEWTRSIRNAGRKLSVISFHLLLPWGSSELINGVKHTFLFIPGAGFYHCGGRRWPGARRATVPSWSFWCCMLMCPQDGPGNPWCRGWGAGVKGACSWVGLTVSCGVALGGFGQRRGGGFALDWVLLGGEVMLSGGMFGPFSDVDNGFYFPLCLDLIMESSCFCLIQ